MEGSRKRKATNATPSSADGSASKKLRLLNSNPAPAPKSNVQDVGFKVVELVRKARDKHGRSISIEFLSLPDRDDFPDYYESTALPLAVDTIEEKLERNEYATITAIESDLKRLVQNAKDYNHPSSQIYGDAERIRKSVFNFMKDNNPAYKEDPEYASFPTPLPAPKRQAAPLQNGRHDDESADDVKSSRQTSIKVKRAASAATSEQVDRKSSIAPSATTGDGDGEGDEEEGFGGGALDFTGMSFQEAQQKIVSFLLSYTDEDGLEIYSPFGNLPSRKLVDYYEIIKHPVSLKSVAKHCRGIHGRLTVPTGLTDYKSWDAFEDEISFIWKNAKEYNEDGSDMYLLAEEFEQQFKSILAEAKEKIDEPSGPKIKIGAPKPKVLLNLSQHRSSPAPGVSVDNDSLARQRLMVQAGVNGQHPAPRPPVLTNGISRPNSQVLPADGTRPTSSGHSGSPLTGPIKSEKTSTQSPVPEPPLTNGMMLPPAVRPTSGAGSPFPLQPTITNHYTTPLFLPPTQTRSYPKTSALLPKVTLATHPHLKIPRPFSLAIPPHDTLSHQSTTTTLPASHYFFHISATISKQLSMGRPYKLFATLNGTRLVQKDTQAHADSGQRTHLYEGSLAPGVNRVEVEVAAAKMGSAGEVDAKGLDVEKVTVFANLMKG